MRLNDVILYHVKPLLHMSSRNQVEKILRIIHFFDTGKVSKAPLEWIQIYFFCIPILVFLRIGDSPHAKKFNPHHPGPASNP